VANFNGTSIGINGACNRTPTKTMKPATQVLDESLPEARLLLLPTTQELCFVKGDDKAKLLCCSF